MPNISYTNDASGYTLNTPLPSFGGATGGGPGMDFSGLDSFYRQMAERKAREEERRRAEEARRLALQEKMQASGFNMNAEEHRAKMAAEQQARAQQTEAWQRQKNLEDTPASLVEQGWAGTGLGSTIGMPWQKGAGNSGYTMGQIKQMQPENATFAPGAGDPSMLQRQLAGRQAEDDETEQEKNRKNAMMSLYNKWS